MAQNALGWDIIHPNDYAWCYKGERKVCQAKNKRLVEIYRLSISKCHHDGRRFQVELAHKRTPLMNSVF
ncbi:hypothetical protein Hdeb2414_s0001g00007501 [Helianthus debilis subsp. tardiflorus]